MLEKYGYQYTRVDGTVGGYIEKFAGRSDIFSYDFGRSRLELVGRAIEPEDIARAIALGPAIRFFILGHDRRTHVGGVTFKGAGRLGVALEFRKFLAACGIRALVDHSGTSTRARVSVEERLPAATVRSAMRAALAATGLDRGTGVSTFPGDPYERGLTDATVLAPLMRDPASGEASVPVDYAGRPTAFSIEELLHVAPWSGADAIRRLGRLGSRGKPPRAPRALANG